MDSRRSFFGKIVATGLGLFGLSKANARTELVQQIRSTSPGGWSDRQTRKDLLDFPGVLQVIANSSMMTLNDNRREMRQYAVVWLKNPIWLDIKYFASRFTLPLRPDFKRISTTLDLDSTGKVVTLTARDQEIA